MSDALPMPVTSLTSAQRTAVINLVRRAAKAEILPRFRALGAGDIREKTDAQDLVTDADEAAEKMIARGLLSMFPNALIVGEEEVSRNKDILDKIAEAETAFTIDPVDGTWNFAKGLAVFGVIVSMTRFGKPVFGLLYDPIMDDFVTADIDEPARMLRPRKAPLTMRASKGGALEGLTGFLPHYTLPDDKKDQMAATYSRFARVSNLRCACHEFRMFAQGHADFMMQSRLTPWDHAAGVLIAKQAGGHAAMLDGSDYSAENRDGVLLVASDAATWGRIRDVMEFML